jgi:outer membrane protein assembly factor BamB
MRLLTVGLAVAAAWTRFRGPNGSGVAETGALPAEFSKDKNLVWSTALPAGFSSPVVGERCVFLTAYEGPRGWALCVDKKTGKELWRADGFTLRTKDRPVNTPVSPTPVTDGRNVYVFFEAAGLISYDQAGKERWRRELGPFSNPYGMANSPMLVGGLVILQVDQDVGSYLLAVSAKDGAVEWKTPRPEANHGYSTPVVWQPKAGDAQLIVSGSYQVAAYSVKTGKKLWWVEGMAWQAKSAPVIQGGLLFVHSWMAGLSELVTLPEGKSWSEFVDEYDKDQDGRVGKPEAPEKEMARLWFLFDLDGNGFIERTDYENIQARQAAKSGLFAIRLGGRGNVTSTAVVWKAEKQLPNIPSPLLYKGVLYILKEGGILTAYEPATGRVLRQGRVEGALDGYFASPVAGDGKLFLAAQSGKVAVVQAGAEWTVARVNDLDEETWATPAIDSAHLYVRTQRALYCFGLR